MKKLTKQQVQQLYTFTKQHYVEYYDLQTELVDHLANGIEEQWLQNETLTFNEALQKEFKKYGIFGFTDLVEKRQVAMGKRYAKLVWKLFKQYFTIPKIVLTAMLILLTKIMIDLIADKENVIISFAVVIFILLANKAIIKGITMRKKKKKDEKLWLFEETIYSYGANLGFFNILIQLPIVFIRSERLGRFLSYQYGSTFGAIVMVITGVVFYVVLFEIPKNAKKYIAKEHPEYNIV